MGDSENIVGLVIALVILAGALVFFDISDLSKWGSDDGGSSVGDGRDSHGCLTSSGFEWNSTEQACVRPWESGVLRYQVKDYKTCKDAGYSISDGACEAPNGDTFPR